MSLALLLSIGLGGFMGAILRFSISSWITKVTLFTLPWGTLVVNVLGSFFIGFLFFYFQHSSLSASYKAFFITGLLGALTTFSTFSLDTVLLIDKGFYLKALLNVLLNLLCSIGATLLGIWSFKRFIID